MLNKINLEVIKSFSPCKDGLINFIKHHESFEGTPIELLKLDNIPLKDKLWLLLRTYFIPERQLHEYVIFSAELVLPIFEKKYPNDDRPRKAIQAKRDWLDGKISDEELSNATEAATAATNATYAAYAVRSAAYGVYAASYAAAKSADRSAAYAASAGADAAKAAADAKLKEVEEKQLNELIRIFETL